MTTIDDDIGPIQPRRQTAQQFGRSVRTIERWEQDPELGFPKAIQINGRNYDSCRKINEFKRQQAERARAVGGAA